MKNYRVLFGRFLENDHVVLSLPLLSEEQESPSAAKIAGEAIPAIPVCLSNVAMQPARPSPLPPVLEMQLRDVIQARHARHAWLHKPARCFDDIDHDILLRILRRNT